MIVARIFGVALCLVLSACGDDSSSSPSDGGAAGIFGGPSGAGGAGGAGSGTAGVTGEAGSSAAGTGSAGEGGSETCDETVKAVPLVSGDFATRMSPTDTFPATPSKVETRGKMIFNDCNFMIDVTYGTGSLTIALAERPTTSGPLDVKGGSSITLPLSRNSMAFTFSNGSAIGGTGSAKVEVSGPNAVITATDVEIEVDGAIDAGWKGSFQITIPLQ